jgi:tight adherence protein C
MYALWIAEVSLEIAIPVAAFLAASAAAWFVSSLLAGRRSRSEERLDRFSGKRASVAEKTSVVSSEGFARMLESVSPALAKPLQPKTAREVGKLKERLNVAGFRRDEAVMMFLGLKFISLAIGLCLGGGVAFLTAGMTISGLMRALMIAGLFFFAPDIVLGFLGKKRKEAIFLGLPDALDLLVVCVEAGLGLDQAMRKVADEMTCSKPIIAHEFGLCNMQLQMGRTREEVFQELGKRNGVDDLKTLASVIIQTDKFGSSVARALRVQSDSMRTQRRQIAEEKAAKTAVKLIFPLVIFIFPGIFVVLVGPAAITMVNEMLPAFQGR